MMFSQNVRQLRPLFQHSADKHYIRVKDFNDTSTSPAATLGLNSDSRLELYIPNIMPSDLVLLLYSAKHYYTLPKQRICPCCTIRKKIQILYCMWFNLPALFYDFLSYYVLFSMVFPADHSYTLA